MSEEHVNSSMDGAGPREDPPPQTPVSGDIGPGTPLPDGITAAIDAGARKMIGKWKLRSCDLDDLRQQITLEVLAKRSKLGGTKAGDAGLLQVVTRHAIADVLEARRAQYRSGPKRIKGLTETSKDRDHHGCRVELSEVLTSHDGARRTYNCHPCDQGRNLCTDLAAAMATLSPYLKKVMQHYVAAGCSSRGAAKTMGVHNTVICDAIRKVKEHMRAAGMESYLLDIKRDPRV